MMQCPEEKLSSVVDCRPKRRLDLNVRDIEGESVVVDRQNGFVHQFNAVASLIWSCCDGESTVQNIAADVVAVYGIDFNTAINDVVAVVAEFRRLRLLAT